MAHTQLARLKAEGKLEERLRPEILAGELVIQGLPSLSHERAVNGLSRHVLAWTRQRGGEAFTGAGVEVGEHQLAPDLSFIGPAPANSMPTAWLSNADPTAGEDVDGQGVATQQLHPDEGRSLGLIDDHSPGSAVPQGASVVQPQCGGTSVGQLDVDCASTRQPQRRDDHHEPGVSRPMRCAARRPTRTR
jgi:hypothetical protein